MDIADVVFRSFASGGLGWPLRINPLIAGGITAVVGLVDVYVVRALQNKLVEHLKEKWKGPEDTFEIVQKNAIVFSGDFLILNQPDLGANPAAEITIKRIHGAVQLVGILLRGSLVVIAAAIFAYLSQAHLVAALGGITMTYSFSHIAPPLRNLLSRDLNTNEAA